VDRAAVPLFTRIKYTLVCIEPRVGGQQRRMDVQDLARVVIDEPRAQYAHEASKDQQVGLMLIKFMRERLIKGFPIGVVCVFNTTGMDARIGGAPKAVRIRAVAADGRNVQGEFAACDPVDERLQVAARTGN
jgi:hypothetical protein